MSDQKSAPWVCPWDICNHQQAQECRAEMRMTKRTRGCGTYFAPTTTPEEARAQVRRPLPATGASQHE